MPIDPATAALAIGTVKDFFGKLIGTLPRGDMQKFKRTIYPMMVQKADDTGSAVYAAWFGDAVRVAPGGGWGSIAKVSSIGQFFALMDVRAEKEGVLYAIRCDSVRDWNDPAQVATCTFQRITGSFMGRVIETVKDFIPGETVSTGPTPVEEPIVVQKAGFGIETGIFAIVGVVALLLILPRLASSRE